MNGPAPGYAPPPLQLDSRNPRVNSHHHPYIPTSSDIAIAPPDLDAYYDAEKRAMPSRY